MDARACSSETTQSNQFGARTASKARMSKTRIWAITILRLAVLVGAMAIVIIDAAGVIRRHAKRSALLAADECAATQSSRPTNEA